MSKVLTRLQDSITDRACGFITEWEINGGDRSITLPLYNSGTFNCTVDWGDGTTSTITSWNDADKTHVYAADRRYRVEITGDCPGWSFNNTGSKLKIIRILSWGDESLFSGFTYLIKGFMGCENLESMPTTGRILGTGVISFNYLFTFCSKLKNITNELFYNHINATNFSSLFLYCYEIKFIPSDLFKYNINAFNFSNTFSGTGITSVPADLFRYNVNVSEYAFSYTFNNCTSLTLIPVDLFRYNLSVSDMGFEYTFRNCTSLTSIPANLFKYNVNVSTYGFTGTFENCNRLQLNKWIFYSEGEENTRFLNKSINFANCFNRSWFAGIQGEAPELWNCDFGTGTVTKTDCYNGDGNSLSSLSNYASIPDEWK